MKAFIPFLFAAVVLAGCSSYGGGSASTETPATPATAETPKPTYTVAADSVVRNADGKAVCVVMNTPVEGDESQYESRTVDGVKYIFCCKSCPGMFDKDPAKYAVAKK